MGKKTTIVAIVVASTLVGCKSENRQTSAPQTQGLASQTHPPAPIPESGTPTKLNRLIPYKTRDIVLGFLHSCLIDDRGTPLCWGSNDGGEASPPKGDQFASITVGLGFSCGLTPAGRAICWGDVTSPPNSLRFRELHSGKHVVCGVTTAGSVHCWPHRVTVPPSLVQIRVGEPKWCGISAEGALLCWAPDKPEERAIIDRGPFVALEVAEKAICAIRDTGHVFCSGLRGEAPKNQQFKQISVSAINACGVTVDDGVICWGEWNKVLPTTPVAGFSKVAVTDGVACATEKSTSLTRCWGASFLPAEYVDISYHGEKLCTLTAAGEATCMSRPPIHGIEAFATNITRLFESREALGQTDSGSLRILALPCGEPEPTGCNEPSDAFPPSASGYVFSPPPSLSACFVLADESLHCVGAAAPAPRLSKVAEVCLGNRYGCALAKDGSVHCWGRPKPRPTSTEPAQAIACAWNHVCALYDDRAECFGENMPPTTRGKFADIQTSGTVSCALGEDGVPSCWGPKAPRNQPSGSFEKIAVGYDEVCGLRRFGQIECWKNDGLEKWGHPLP